jgi:hypothetical protein
MWKETKNLILNNYLLAHFTMINLDIRNVELITYRLLNITCAE